MNYIKFAEKMNALIIAIDSDWVELNAGNPAEWKSEKNNMRVFVSMYDTPTFFVYKLHSINTNQILKVQLKYAWPTVEAFIKNHTT